MSPRGKSTDPRLSDPPPGRGGRAGRRGRRRSRQSPRVTIDAWCIWADRQAHLIKGWSAEGLFIGWRQCHALIGLPLDDPRHRLQRAPRVLRKEFRAESVLLDDPSHESVLVFGREGGLSARQFGLEGGVVVEPGHAEVGVRVAQMRQLGVGAPLEAGPMTAATWGCCLATRRLGELLTRGDVCHVHADRAAAERCGVLLGGARPSGSGSMRSGPRSTARGVVADERRERSLHGAMLLIVERNGVMEAESS